MLKNDIVATTERPSCIQRCLYTEKGLWWPLLFILLRPPGNTVKSEKAPLFAKLQDKASLCAKHPNLIYAVDVDIPVARKIDQR